MTKSEAMRRINDHLRANVLTNQNTHWSNIVTYGTGEGWWLNIPFRKFRADVHLILNSADESKYVHLRVPANTLPEPRTVFRAKGESADIFMPSSGRNRLVDVQSGSSKHDFGRYEATEHSYVSL